MYWQILQLGIRQLLRWLLLLMRIKLLLLLLWLELQLLLRYRDVRRFIVVSELRVFKG